MNLKKEALKYHSSGKTSLQPSKPLNTSHDLSLAYSPGVAEPYLEIARGENLAYIYTDETSLIAIVNDDSAVLGLGSIGALVSKSVMEGRTCLFKKFTNIDAFDLEIDARGVEEIIAFCKTLTPSVGGINLEDISVPKCFTVEAASQELGIPVMHDDQHGTAIISTAELMSAMEISDKSFKSIKAIINGTEAAGIASAKMHRNLGAENIILVNNKGVISKDGADPGIGKLEFTKDTEEKTLRDAMYGADIFLGLSKPSIINERMLKSTAQNPVIFALANPVPGVMSEFMHQVRKDAIVGTGRSDYVNQINNILSFPFIFRGVLNIRASKITENMRIAVTKALADLVKLPVGEEMRKAYAITYLEFSKNYVIPKLFGVRVKALVSIAMAKAVIDDGVTKIKEFDEEAYFKSLRQGQ